MLLDDIVIGFNKNTITSNKETLKQIKEIMKYDLDVEDINGRKIEWKDIYDEMDKNSLFYVIYKDRKDRKNNMMADRPPYLRFGVVNDTIVIVEFYFGHDKLVKIYEFRSKKIDDSIMLEPYIDNVEYEKDNFIDILGIQKIHEAVTKPEISYLKIRNTVTIQQHREDLSQGMLKELLKALGNNYFN